jgi:hypothetical protein
MVLRTRSASTKEIESWSCVIARRRVFVGPRGGRDPRLLWQRNIARSFLAHEIAMHLGSRACALAEELARGMWEGTAPDAEYWQSMGVSREQLPMPDDVSWRDRFLLFAGRNPHCL